MGNLYGSRMGYHGDIVLKTNEGVLFRAGWKHIFCIPEKVGLGDGSDCSMGKRNTMCCKSGMEIYFYLVLWLFIFYFAFYYIFCVEFLLNCQVMVTFLGRCCWFGRRVP